MKAKANVDKNLKALISKQNNEDVIKIMTTADNIPCESNMSGGILFQELAAHSNV